MEEFATFVEDSVFGTVYDDVLNQCLKGGTTPEDALVTSALITQADLLRGG